MKNMARQISIYNEVYEMLSKIKSNKSFSEVIKEALQRKNENVLKFSGIISKAEAKKWKAEIQKEREENHGRLF